MREWHIGVKERTGRFLKSADARKTEGHPQISRRCQDHIKENLYADIQAFTDRTSIELLDERRTAIISPAVTGKIDLRLFGGKNIYR